MPDQPKTAHMRQQTVFEPMAAPIKCVVSFTCTTISSTSYVAVGKSTRQALRGSIKLSYFVVKVGRPGFHSLVESEQKTLKVGIHSFPA